MVVDLDKTFLVRSMRATCFRPGEVAMVVERVTENPLARALIMEGFGVPECFRTWPCLVLLYPDGVSDVVPVASLECGEYEVVDGEEHGRNRS